MEPCSPAENSKGIRHVTTAPYHPASNGRAERAVQTLKSGLKKISTGTLEERLSSFLFQYRNTPHTTTGISPAELLMGRRPCSHLDLLKPDISSRIRSKQEKQKSCHDHGTKPRNFMEGDSVFIRNFGQGQRWVTRKQKDYVLTRYSYQMAASCVAAQTTFAISVLSTWHSTYRQF